MLFSHAVPLCYMYRVNKNIVADRDILELRMGKESPFGSL